MSTERRTGKKGIRTLKHRGEVSTWSTIAHFRRNESYQVIGDDSSTRKCFVRPSIRNRPKSRGAPDTDMDFRASDDRTKLSSIAEHIIVDPIIFLRGSRDAADPHLPNPPTTMDHPQPVSVHSEKSSSRPPSSNASRPDPNIHVQGREPQEGNGNEEKVDAEWEKVEAEVQVVEEVVGENVTSVSIADQLSSDSEGPTPSSIYRRDTSQRSTRQPALSQAVADRSSSTGRQVQYSPAESRHGRTDTRSVSEQQGLPPRDMKVSGDEGPTQPTLIIEAPLQSGMGRAQRAEPPSRPEALPRAGSVGVDDQALNEEVVVVEMASDSDSDSSDQHVVVVTEPISIQGHERSRPPSRQPSVTPARPSRQRSLRPPQAESTYQRQVPSLSLNAFDDPQQFQGLDDPTISEYPGASRPAWYVPPGPDDSSAYGATSQITKGPQGHYYPPTRDITLAPNHEPRLSVAEQVTRFDQGSFHPQNPPSHTHRSLSKAPQQSWIGAGTHESRAEGELSGIPPEHYPERPVSRIGHQRPISTARSAYGTSRMPLVSRGTQSVIEQGSNVQRPHPKQYRRLSPSSDSERSLHSAMGSGVNSRSRAYPLPSSHPHGQRPPPKRGAISQAKPSIEGSRRPLTRVVPHDDPPAADGGGSSSSVSSAALEELGPEIVARGRKLPHPAAVGTLTPESRKSTTSRRPPPPIYVVPAFTPSPPPSSLGGTKVGPPTSMADSQPTLRPKTINKNASPRSAQKQIYPEGIEQSASRRSEHSRRPLNEPSQDRQTSQVPLDPDHRGPERSLKPWHVPGRRPALPGLSRIGSSGSLRDQAQAAELSSEGEDSQSASGYFTENDDDRTSDYSDDSDEFDDDRRPVPSSSQMAGLPQAARHDPRGRQSRHVEDDRSHAAKNRPAPPIPGLGLGTQTPFPGQPSRQRPVNMVATKNGSETRGRGSRSRSRMPGGFPGGA